MVEERETLQEIAEQICSMEGVTKVHMETSITVTHKRVNTGETDDMHQPIRERVVSEEEFEDVAEELNLDHTGTIDVVGDFHLRDRFSRYEILGVEDLGGE